MISVGNSTMTITTLILLLATGIVAVTVVHGQQAQNDHLINNCCQLGYGHLVISPSPGRLNHQDSMLFPIIVRMIIWKLRLIVTLVMEEEDG